MSTRLIRTIRGLFHCAAGELNGVIILDADLSLVKEPEVLKKHPGLKNKTGHIGFLGHGSLVEFRNIRIKQL